jgi:16S rRNA processing protein RimM
MLDLRPHLRPYFFVEPQKLILLGHIAAAHGIRGEVLVKTYTDAPADIAAYGPLTDATGTKSYKLKVLRVTPKGVIARVDGVADRNAAEALKGTALHVDRATMGEADPGEYFYSDLIGLAAHAPDGTRLGIIKAVNDFGAGDLLEIAFDGSGRSEFVAFTDANVPEVDIAGGRVIVIMPADDGSKPEDEPKDL